jgi:hypothetical protein
LKSPLEAGAHGSLGSVLATAACRLLVSVKFRTATEFGKFSDRARAHYDREAVSFCGVDAATMAVSIGLLPRPTQPRRMDQARGGGYALIAFPQRLSRLFPPAAKWRHCSRIGVKAEHRIASRPRTAIEAAMVAAPRLLWLPSALSRGCNHFLGGCRGVKAGSRRERAEKAEDLGRGGCGDWRHALRCDSSREGGYRDDRVLCGGFAENSLRQAGCVEVFPGPAALFAKFDHCLLAKK